MLINICWLTCVLKEEQCWMILCSSSWTSSTQRRLGSSSLLICRFTNNSKETSGTKSAGRGPCRAHHKHIKTQILLFTCYAAKWENLTWIWIKQITQIESGEAHRSIADGSEDIKLGQSSQGVDGLQSAAEGLMEYVTDPSAPASVEETGWAVTPTRFLIAVCQQS